MPTLDNYSLGNYGLGGFVQSSALVQTPSISETIAINPASVGNVRTIADIPPSSLISISSINASNGKIGVTSSSTNLSYHLALLDDANRVWIVGATSNTSISYYALQISEATSAICIFENNSALLSNATAKTSVSNNMPTGFNMKGNMKLCLYVSYNTVNPSANLQLFCSNVRVVSA
ncbi:hypothetical protein [Paenibacillus sp. UASWS1643]|uniref:hypothetical protein n=1 Tax=Paenibacillus sp. UASWS1643 TaxID=2580422 RepID=UPI00123A139C|nr:hypothetical protein [Paenibacillus sp. UASWS1643]KAA8750084.1 hypothetical protein FE296_15920 [Paenibacillus sp. UASWS1643]